MALYLSHLSFQNIRGFKHFELSFDSQKTRHRQWTVFIGNNGHGKTTVLRAIALGLGDERTSSELLSLLPGEFIRVNKKGNYQQPSQIVVTLRDYKTDRVIKIKTHLERDGSGSVRVRKEVDDANFSWKELFVCGYGSNRGIGGRMHSQYALRNSLLTLFNDRAGLLEPESILRDFALLAAQRKSNQPDPQIEMHSLLRKLWGLQPNHSLEITAERVIIHGPWGGMPFHALGDGYRGTGSWLLDLLGNNLKAGRWPEEPKLAGIVLLDEMDEHLHPRWQKSLVPTLRKLLPNIQFIATTHSPLAIVNTREGELYATQLHNAVAELVPNSLSVPSGRNASEILMGEWFGLESTFDSSSERLLVQYRNAFRNGNRAEMERLEPELHRKIKSFLPSGLDTRTQALVDEVRSHELSELTPDQRKELISDSSKRMRALLEGKK